MAKTLAETINQQLSAPAEAAQLGQTERAAGLLRAKLGKASGEGEGPRRSAQREKIAAQQTQAMAGEQQLRGQLMGEQLVQQSQGIEAAEQEQELSLAEQGEDIQAHFEQQSANLLNDLLQEKKQIGAAQDRAKIEQLGFNIRLSNKKYVDNLQREGEKARLDNDLSFKQALVEDLFAEQKTLFASDLAFKRLADATDREYAAELSRMGFGAAQQLAQAEIRQAQAAGIFSGISGIAEAGVSYYKDSGKEKE